jgi:ion channel-forming bestrophin family protein
MIEYNSRSSFGVLFKFRGSVIPQLVLRVFITLLLGCLALYLHREYGLKLSATVHTLLGAALGLLLVFRTNASYDRFWEGRKLLGAMVNRTRDFVRQAAFYIEGEDDEANRARGEMQRRIVVLYALIRQYLRNERNLDELGAPITPEEKAGLADVFMRPLTMSTWITGHLAEISRKGRVTPTNLMLMDANLTALCDFWGGAERIRKTPIPFAYFHHIRSLLTLFCFTVPFAIVDALGLLTPIAAAAVAYGLFGIEEIGVEIEDPFGYDPNDLPLEAIGQRITDDTRQALSQRDAIKH